MNENTKNTILQTQKRFMELYEKNISKQGDLDEDLIYYGKLLDALYGYDLQANGDLNMVRMWYFTIKNHLGIG